VNVFTDALLGRIRSEIDEATRITWPAKQWADDPVGFFRTVLGVEPWDRQIEMLEALRDNRFGACSAGRKVSKSNTIAGGALWWYCTQENARAVLMSTTSRQVDEILWTEVRQMVARSGRCVDCVRDDPHGPRPCPHSAVITGEIHQLARSGMKAPDFRSIVGYTTRDAVAAQGTSGFNLRYFLDESSGVPDPIIHALEGNCAGGGGIWMWGNPTKSDGLFYDAFKKPDKKIKTLTISSEETPNVKSGRTIIPGLADRDYIERMKRDYGEDSALYRIHVRGEFVESEDGKILSANAIIQSVMRWWDTPADGRLYIGLDPAGEGGQGDETVMVARRGLKMLDSSAQHGLSHDAILASLLMMLSAHRSYREVPVVVVDREGSIGAPLWGVLRTYASNNPGAFEVVGVRASDRAQNVGGPVRYDRQRDALWANMADWVRRGGAIKQDPKLEAELHAPGWKFDEWGRLKATAKTELRKMIGRSPDRADALALAVWEFTSQREETVEAPPEPADLLQPPTLDPYAGAMYWER
jgi:hypothetical protein